MDSVRVYEQRGRPDLAEIAVQEQERRETLEAVRLAVPHDDHEHHFNFAPGGAHPPELKLRCGVCRRAIREMTLDHSAGVCILGGLFAEGRPGELKPGAWRMVSKNRLRAADCFDASPGGWSAGTGRSPTHYRYICRHHGQDSRPMLSRKVTAETLLARYLDAVCAGASSIVLD